MDDREELLRRLYQRFNERDIDGVLAAMAPDVDWPNGWEGGRVQGHDEVRDYWQRQFQAIRMRVVPLSFRQVRADQLEVEVEQSRLADDGTVLAQGVVTHTYTFGSDGVTRMDIGQRA